MENPLLNILKIILQISNGNYFYLFQITDKEYKINISFGEFDDNDQLILNLNTDIKNFENPNATELKYKDSFKKLMAVYNINSVYIQNVKETNYETLYLVGLSKNETLFNKSIKDKIELCLPLLKDYLVKNGKPGTSEIENSPIINSQEKFNFIIESSEDFIFVLNNLGVFQQINVAGARSLGFLTEELIGKHFLDMVDEQDKDETMNAFQNILQHQTSVEFEISLVDKYNRKNKYSFFSKPVLEDDKIIGLLSYGRNITQQSKSRVKLDELKEKYKEANRLISIERDRAKQQISLLEELNRLKNDFISNVSHELRTPLASIVGFSETIASDPQLPRETVDEFNSIILAEGKRLAKLVNDILDFSKLESGEDVLDKSYFDIVESVNEISVSYKSLASEKGLNFNLEIPEAEIIIYADRDRIVKAIGHILANAVKFTNQNGIVTVIIQDFLKEVEVIISDTGIGIPKDQIPNLFQKFTKINRPGAQVPGAGIGLVTVKKIVDAHKGLIKIKSDLDMGTTVVVRLPKNINN